MNDMASVIAPKSDQINADDLIGREMVITITGVKIAAGQEQPVSIEFEGSKKVFRPCKSMSRVLVAAWGPDTSKYIGRSIKLYRDPDVTWGGLKVGGIRICEMTDLDGGRAMTLALTEAKGRRKPAVIRPLVMQKASARQEAAPPQDDATEQMHQAEARNAARRGTTHFREWWNTEKGVTARPAAKKIMGDLQKLCDEADAAPKEEDPFGLPPLKDEHDGDGVVLDTTPTPEQLAAATAEAEAYARAQAADAEREG